MKKIIALLIFVCAGAALFAQTVKLSVGGGANFTMNFTTATLNKDYTETDEYKKNDKDAYHNSTLTGFGIYGFFDATYVEANLGVLFGKQTNDGYPPGSGVDYDNYKKGFDVTALKIGLFGKYPFEISGAFSVFPMIGLDVMLPLGGTMWGKNLDDKDLKDTVTGMGKAINKNYNNPKTDYFDKVFTQVWVKFGVGLDINATDKIFVRPEFLYGIRFGPNDIERDQSGTYNTKAEPAIDGSNRRAVSSYLGHGLDIRVAVGYRF